MERYLINKFYYLIIWKKSDSLEEGIKVYLEDKEYILHSCLFELARIFPTGLSVERILDIKENNGKQS